jgi:hypothetical protein
MRGGEVYDLRDRSLAVLRLPRSAEAEEAGGTALAISRRARGDVASRAPA